MRPFAGDMNYGEGWNEVGTLDIDRLRGVGVTWERGRGRRGGGGDADASLCGYLIFFSVSINKQAAWCNGVQVLSIHGRQIRGGVGKEC